MSNLVEHAKRELELIGEDKDHSRVLIEMIEVFDKLGASGGQAACAIAQLNTLLQLENLGPLTDNPAEWYHHGQDGNGDFWQNRRNGEAFSNDGGKTYYLLSEGASEANPHPTHTSAKA